MEIVTVQRRFLADYETPTSAFQKLKAEGACYLLESAEDPRGSGRYSFLGVGPRVIVSSSNEGIFLYRKGPSPHPPKGDDRSSGHRGLALAESPCAASSWPWGMSTLWSRTRLDARSPLQALSQIMGGYRIAGLQASDAPRFTGGAVGYLSYDVVRYIERLPSRPPDALGLPEMLFVITDVVVIFDHLRHTITIISFGLDEVDVKAVRSRCHEQVERIASILARPLDDGLTSPRFIPGDEFNPAQSPGRKESAGPAQYADVTQSAGAAESAGKVRHAAKTQGADVPQLPKDEQNCETASLDEAQFCRAVEIAKSYIEKGDIFQVVLSRRVTCPLDVEPFEVYRALRSLNPSPYLYYLDFGCLQVIGSSPETLVRAENGIVETRPIAGTRPRGHSESEDKRLAQDLLSDEKERAEHVMLVDLARNDIGRVAAPGTVTVPTFMEIQCYSDVMHIVSTVRGELRDGYDAFDVLAACFPAGTVSGAPKVRAMEIIDELEPVARGIYAGAVGYFGFNGNMDMAIAIRTLVTANGQAHVQAGAGIVADSVPEREFLESQHKARAIFRAMKLARGREECDFVAAAR